MTVCLDRHHALIDTRAMRAHDPPPTPDHVEAALEASCDALVTLESGFPGAGEWTRDAVGAHGHIARALHALREAIDELRLAQSEHGSGLAMGFVLNGEATTPDFGMGGRQSRPLRTA